MSCSADYYIVFWSGSADYYVVCIGSTLPPPPHHLDTRGGSDTLAVEGGATRLRWRGWGEPTQTKEQTL
jgi:hypothetical protein